MTSTCKGRAPGLDENARAMGRSKRLNSKAAKAVIDGHGRNELSDVAFGMARAESRSPFGGKPLGKLVRDTRRPAKTENNWLHGVLFVVIALIVVAWALGYVTGRHRAQIIYFFGMQIGSRTPSGIGLRSGSRRHRMRQRLGLSRELWIEIFGKSWPIEV